MILDIHTHHKVPQPLGIVDASPLAVLDFEAIPNQCYSAGIHPWDTVQPISEDVWSELERRLSLPGFVAVGEAGVDMSGRAGMLFVQIQVLKRQIDLSERLGKPMIMHCVKAEDVICGLRRDLKPSQPWIIHGFRKKPETAQQLLRAGCLISLGEHFNYDTLSVVPDDCLLAETDTSPLSIEEIISTMSNVADRDLFPVIAANSARVLHLTDDYNQKLQ